MNMNLLRQLLKTGWNTFCRLLLSTWCRWLLYAMWRFLYLEWTIHRSWLSCKK